MKRKALSLVFALIFCLSLLPLSAAAEETPYAGEPQEITEFHIEAAKKSFVYDGEYQSPVDVKVYTGPHSGGTLLSSDDYSTFGHTREKNVDVYLMGVQLCGNYTSPSKAYLEWEITQREVNQVVWKNVEDRFYGDGKSVTAEIGNRCGEDDVTAVVTGGNQTAIGTHKAVVAGLDGDEADNYKLPAEGFEISYTIEKAPANFSIVDGALDVYTGKADSYSFDFASLLPELGAGKSFGNCSYTVEENTLPSEWQQSAELEEDTGVLRLGIRAVDTEEQKELGTVTVKVRSTNYKDFTLKLKVSSMNRREVPLTVQMESWNYGDAPKEPVFDKPEGSSTQITYKKGSDILPGVPTAAGNYTVSVRCEKGAEIYTGTAPFKVKEREVTLRGVRIKTKEYDGLRAAVVDDRGTLDNVVTGDALTYDITAEFTKKDAGGPQEVRLDVALKGSAKENYRLSGETQTTAAGIIEQKSISVTGATIVPKKYDGDDRAAVDAVEFDGLASGETLQGTGENKDYTVEAVFRDGADAGTNKNVRVTFALHDTETAKNYKWTSIDTRDGYIFENAVGEIVPENGGSLGRKELSQKCTDRAPKVYTPDFDLLGLPGGQNWIYSGGVTSCSSGAAVTSSIDGATGALSYTVTNGRANDQIQWTIEASCGNYGNFTHTVVLTLEKGSSSGGSGSGASSVYAITVQKEGSGTAAASLKAASKGSKVTITALPDSDFRLETLTVVDSKEQKQELTDQGSGKYSFVMPASDVEVRVSFVKEGAEDPFQDVKADDYYYEAVKWAKKNGITGGTGADLFEPNEPCTRAQIVTFLFRAADSPEPERMSHFTDVPENGYYAKAVAWAVSQGIAVGTSEETFSPEAVCTRAHSVTFLFRAAKAEAEEGASSFSDVSNDAYYAAAVQWATENGITNGIGNGLFGPNDSCTRGQIVTFLYRFYANH